jgi:hypothetical protein
MRGCFRWWYKSALLLSDLYRIWKCTPSEKICERLYSCSSLFRMYGSVLAKLERKSRSGPLVLICYLICLFFISKHQLVISSWPMDFAIVGWGHRPFWPTCSSADVIQSISYLNPITVQLEHLQWFGKKQLPKSRCRKLLNKIRE